MLLACDGGDRERQGRQKVWPHAATRRHARDAMPVCLPTPPLSALLLPHPQSAAARPRAAAAAVRPSLTAPHSVPAPTQQSATACSWATAATLCPPTWAAARCSGTASTRSPPAAAVSGRAGAALLRLLAARWPTACLARRAQGARRCRSLCALCRLPACLPAVCWPTTEPSPLPCPLGSRPPADPPGRRKERLMEIFGDWTHHGERARGMPCLRCLCRLRVGAEQRRVRAGPCLGALPARPAVR